MTVPDVEALPLAVQKVIDELNAGTALIRAHCTNGEVHRHLLPLLKHAALQPVVAEGAFLGVPGFPQVLAKALVMEYPVVLVVLSAHTLSPKGEATLIRSMQVKRLRAAILVMAPKVNDGCATNTESLAAKKLPGAEGTPDPHGQSSAPGLGTPPTGPVVIA